MAHDASTNEHTVSTRSVELAVAASLMAVAVVVMYDSWRIGARWASDGPQAGYFPFYIGLIMFISSAVTFGVNMLARSSDRSNFVDRSQFRRVVQVLIPTGIFVGLIAVIGIYVAAMVFIAFFMWWLGKYSILKIVPVAVLVPLALFVMFEIWFLVPLPKGPIEYALGY